ncbi:LuxR C-terminal-related transcriptional regulator [Desulfovibrio sp. OttesenSCG-928-O18]|nr:LuxR C-terminal-related transcriptional regulator [Desulfovibrio sp. OttesenSCG-928-O18]
MSGKKKSHDRYYFSGHLKRQLERIPEYHLTVVEAPSGFGKTTAVREFLARRRNAWADKRWYTCFGESPLKAWAGICSLFNDCRDIAENLLELGLPTLENLPDITALLRRYRCAKPTVLVIDNYQLFKNDIPRELTHALSACPDESLHIVVITQPLPVVPALMHGDNEQHAITSQDFFFDKECIANYCRLVGINIPEQEIEHIQKASGGWVAAVRLQLALYTRTKSLTDTGDINALINGAIWSSFSEADKAFMSAVALLDGFTAKQAATMGGWASLPEHAAALLSDNFFIRYIADKKVYSMHSILRDYLLRRFDMQPGEVVEAMRRRAAAACLEAGDYFQAAQFFMQVGDHNAILSLPFTTQYFYNIRERSVIEFFERLVDECPEDILHKFPIPLVLIAYLFFRYGLRARFAKTTAIIDRLLQDPKGLPEAELARARAEYSMLMSFTEYNDIVKMSAYHRKAYGYLKTISEHPRSSVFQGAMPWAVGLPSIMGAYWNKSGNLRNELDAMDDCLPIYSELAAGHGAGAEHVFRAEAELARGEDKAAETLCHAALYRARGMKQFGVCLCAELVLAEIAVLRGDGQAYAAMRAQMAQTAEDAGQRSVSSMGELCLAVLDLNLGNTKDLPAWLCSVESVQKTLYAHAIPYALAIHCHMLSLEDRRVELYALAGHVMDLVQSSQFGRNMNYVLPQVQINLYLAAARQREGNAEVARKHLKSALELALPDSVYLPFARLSSPLPPFDDSLKSGFPPEKVAGLEALCKRNAAGVQSVLAFLRGGGVPLTAREREVARLAKERLSAEEIAVRLAISKNTVNTILKSVYKKLGIHTKSELARQVFL